MEHIIRVLVFALACVVGACLAALGLLDGADL